MIPIRSLQSHVYINLSLLIGIWSIILNYCNVMRSISFNLITPMWTWVFPRGNIEFGANHFQLQAQIKHNELIITDYRTHFKFWFLSSYKLYCHDFFPTSNWCTPSDPICKIHFFWKILSLNIRYVLKLSKYLINFFSNFTHYSF